MSNNNIKNKHKDIFNTALAAILEEDCSEIYKAIQKLKSGGVKDFNKYFDDHPEFVNNAAKMLKILDANDAAVRLYGAKDKAELLTSIETFFSPSS